MNGIESIEQKLDGVPPEETVPRLEIATWREGRAAYLSVRDEGVGMTTEEIAHCTDLFFTTKSAGVGLGMAVVRQYIHENRGNLTIESEHGAYTKVVIQFQEVSVC